MEQLNAQLLAKAMNYHGQQLQKLWEGEHGEHDLPMRGIKDLSFGVYGQRQKHLPFQDRGKRLKLQQFIVKHSSALYAPSIARSATPPRAEDGPITEELYAIMPPFETYVSADRSLRLQYFSENVKMGDLILGTIISKQQSGMMLKVLCTLSHGAHIKYAADINIKAFCPVANVIPAVDKKGVSRSYMMNDYVCCEVLEIIADTDKMVCGMKGTTRKQTDPEHYPPLGLINTDDFPLVYKKALDHKNELYDAVLEKSVGFNNPNNIQYLSELMDVNKHVSLMQGLNGKFPENETAAELRQVQASKWAYRNVADGIDHFKAGKHVEAFQCLNKALHIDPKNVEGLVARGALYANSGNFQKAIEDFETALKLNPNHANARKYMGETLVALGRSYEDENKIDEARKAYQSCLTIIPFHEEAQSSLDFLKAKNQPGTKNLIEPGELLLPNLGASSKTDMNDALKQMLKKNEEEEKKDKKKKGKKKKRKNRRHSSSSSSSSSSGSDSSSSSTSSSSDSSSSSGDSDFKSKKKKRRSRSHRREKQGSLSPLSKRMAMMDQSQDTSNFNFNKPATSFDFSFEQNKPKTADDYEAKVRAFLQETKGDSDYEEKVRKFLEESSKWKKGKGDDKKKKKKKEKKSKRDSRKKKKEKKLKRKSGGFDLAELEDHKKLRDAIKKELSKEKRSKRHLEEEDEYFLQKSGYTARFMESLPDLEELESKLNAYYAMDKEGKRSDDESKRMLDSPSPSREQKARLTVAEAAASASKWKMQIGPSSSGNSRFKKKQLERAPTSSTDWPEDMGRKSGPSYEHTPPKKQMGSSGDKSGSVRKQMEKSIKEPPKRADSPKKSKPMPPALAPAKPVIPAGQVVLDKFGNFRLMTPPEMKKHDMGPIPPGAHSSNQGRAQRNGRRPPEPPGRPRSESRSPKRRSRSRSKFSRSRSTSGSRSRSRSYRSRSRSYYSRSRSRSGSYYSRSRSRSRSYSGDRRRFRRGGGFRGRFNNDRGTYYKPRFQNPRHNNARGSRGGGHYNNRDSRYNDRDYRGGRGGRPFNRPFINRRPRGRFRGGQRDFRDRRYDRSRSRDRSRSFSRSDSDERNNSSNKRVVNEKENNKLNKYADGDGDPVRHEGPLSEGEDRDDYTNNDKVIDRDAFAGKWADKDEAGSSGTAKDINPPEPAPELDA